MIDDDSFFSQTLWTSHPVIYPPKLREPIVHYLVRFLESTRMLRTQNFIHAKSDLLRISWLRSCFTINRRAGASDWRRTDEIDTCLNHLFGSVFWLCFVLGYSLTGLNYVGECVCASPTFWLCWPVGWRARQGGDGVAWGSVRLSHFAQLRGSWRDCSKSSNSVISSLDCQRLAANRQPPHRICSLVGGGTCSYPIADL